jgi:hypothetical protein
MPEVTLKGVICLIKEWDVAKCPHLHGGDGGEKYTHRMQV